MTPEEKDRLKTNIFNSVDFSLSGSAWSEVCRCINEMPEENEPPVATYRTEEEEKNERENEGLRFRMTRMEELFIVLSKGVRIGTKAQHGWGINQEDEQFLTTTWVEIYKELYGEPEEKP